MKHGFSARDHKAEQVLERTATYQPHITVVEIEGTIDLLLNIEAPVSYTDNWLGLG